MKKLNEVFEVVYGNKLDLNKMSSLPLSRGGVCFVGRSSRNHGVSGTVAPLPTTRPYEAGLITVALGGAKLLSSFVQQVPFYTAQNVAVLRPRQSMSFAEKLFICVCIRHNRFRYSAFGREANRTLRTLLVPEPREFPKWVRDQRPDQIDRFAAPAGVAAPLENSPETWRPFALKTLFEIKKGRRLTKASMMHGDTPFIGAIDSNNGVTGYVSLPPLHPGGTITVNYNGAGVAEAFYQPVPYRCSDDVNVLYPKAKMSPLAAMFVAALIRREKYRFSYGRKWHLERMNDSVIRLPTKRNGMPDWESIQQFMASLPYSSQVA